MLEPLDQKLFDSATVGRNTQEKEFIRSNWKKVREYGCQNAGLKKWGPHLLRLDSQEKLEKAFANIIAGLEMTGLKLWKETAHDPHMEDIFRLFFDDDSSLKEVNFTLEEKSALLWKYNENLIVQFRDRFEKIFFDLHAESVWNQHDPLVTEMLIGNLISLYPFFDPPSGHEVELLQLIGGKWTMVRYTAEIIPLVENKIVAHGLIPLNPEAEPLILFSGTPYPAATGFWQAVKSDLHPFRPVGEDIFLQGKHHIAAWMDGKTHVNCYGMSLGGALAYHLGNLYGPKVTIHAYVAPGLFPSLKWMRKIEGDAFHHIADLVADLGYHPTGHKFECYGVITEARRNFLLAHARPVGCNPTLVIKINPIYENQKRRRHIITALKHAFSIILFLIVLPLRLISSSYNWIKKVF